MELATADLWDKYGDALQSVDRPFLNFGGHSTFSGRARTIRCQDDNLLVKKVLAMPGQGNVLVIDGSGSTASALVGDQMATTAIQNSWAGLIINGAVRDRRVLASLPIGIIALGSNPRKSRKLGEGEIDVSLVLGGATIRPGDQLFVDEDGIVVQDSQMTQSVDASC